MAEHDINVKLNVVDNMSQPIADASKKVDSSLNQTKDSFKGLGDEIKGNFVNAIKGAVVAYIGMQGIQKVTQFLKESRLEYQESVRVQAQLRTALGYTSTALNQQAEALGQKLKVDNEEITAVQVKIANYVKNDEAVKKLTPAILDLAAATGMDMASAANIVAKAINDDSDELGKFKIAVDGASGSAERTQSVIDGLTSKFKGQAEALTTSKDGFDEMALSWKNFEEKVGGSNVLKWWADGAASIVNLWTKGMEEVLGVDKKTAESEAEIAKNASAKKVSILKAEQDLKNQIRRDNLEKYKKIKEEEYQAAIDSIEIEKQLKQEEHGATIQSIEIEKQSKEEEYGATIQSIEIEKQLKVEKINGIIKIQNAEAAARQKKINDDLLIKKSDNEKSKNAVNNSLGMAAQLFEGQKKYIGAYKAFAISQAIMDTWASANTNLKSAPMPWGGIAAGFAVALGLANVAKISNQKFETGTAFAPGGMSLINEQGGEYVNLPRGSQVYNNTQTRNMTTNAALNVTIMDSSGNITETIRAQLRSGQGDQLVRDIQAKMARQL